MGGIGLGIDRLIMLLAGDQDPERPYRGCVSPAFKRPFSSPDEARMPKL